MTIDVRTAATQALNYFNSLQDLFTMTQKCEDLMIEEIELTEDNKYWLITIGFNRIDTTNPLVQVGVISNSTSERQYKTLKVDAETGDVKGITIRKL